MVIHPLIRVSRGAAWRQAEEPQLAVGFLHEIGDQVDSVLGVIVHDQEDRALLAVDEPARELYEHGGGRAHRGHHESELSLGGDR